MASFHCPSCGAPLEAPFENGTFACPSCGASIDVHGGQPVIDVEARSLGETRSIQVQSPVEEELREGPRGYTYTRRTPFGTTYVRTVRLEGAPPWVSQGCCGLGCLVVLFGLYLMLRGFASLFFG